MNERLFRMFCVMLPPAIIMLLIGFVIVAWGRLGTLDEKVGMLEDVMLGRYVVTKGEQNV